MLFPIVKPLLPNDSQPLLFELPACSSRVCVCACLVACINLAMRFCPYLLIDYIHFTKSNYTYIFFCLFVQSSSAD